MNTLIERIFYHLYLLLNFIVLRYYYLRIPFFRNKKIKQSILALPYTPQGWPGGYDRMDAWTTMFKTEGYSYKVEYAWFKDDSQLLEKSKLSTLRRYTTYLKILSTRLKLLPTLGQYEHVWVQRAFVPMFPYKDAYFERLISKIHPNIIYDFYDADYASNFNLVMNTVVVGNKVTVATAYLRNKFVERNQQTFLLRYAIDTNAFKIKKQDAANTIKIGWMGSPENAKNLQKIESQLQQLATEFDNVRFSFVCRKLPSLELKNLEVKTWGIAEFDYYDWLASLDIGIVPFVTADERTKAKISMKGLEFMAQGIPMVTSDYVHSDQLVNGTSFFLSDNDAWYDQLKKLVQDTTLRKEMGERALDVFKRFHTYPEVYEKFKEILKIEIYKAKVLNRSQPSD